jgi:hypothetical protein
MIRYIALTIVVSTTSTPRLLSCSIRLRLAGRNTAQVCSQRPEELTIVVSTTLNDRNYYTEHRFFFDSSLDTVLAQ